ncbi:hypothetical protein H4582DRAFT_2191832 [Lactarius indigo]|nr:hypothetical protein H4582DRAFT_2191832 [Lactarius indigo]
MSGGGNPLWFSVGKGSSSSFDELNPTVNTFWKTPDATPGARRRRHPRPRRRRRPHVVQTPAHALAGAPVSVAQFAWDTREPPLAVDRMAVDADKIDNNGLNKWKAIVVLHTRKGHLWALGSKCGPPGALPAVAAAAGGEAMDGAGDEIGGTDCNGGGACAPRPCAPREPVDNAPTVMQGGTANVEEIEKLTPEALRTTLATLPNSAFSMPTTALYTAHVLPARRFSQTATTPIDIKYSAFESLSVFLRASEKGGLLKLKDALPDAQVTGVFRHMQTLLRTDIIAQLGRKMSGRDERSSHNVLVSALITYVEKHDLVNRFEQQFVNIRSDPVLATALYGPSNAKGTPSTLEFAKQDEALSGLCKYMQPLYRITVSGDESIIKKVALRSIMVTAKAR